MMKFIMNERGSISILTILLVIILASFGALTIGISYTSSILAQKNIEWVETFYRLEGEGEKQLSLLDIAVKEGIIACRDKLTTTNKEQFLDSLVNELNSTEHGWQAYPYEDYIDVKFIVSAGSSPGDINLSVAARIEASDFNLYQKENGIECDFLGESSYFRIIEWAEYQIATQGSDTDEFDGTIKDR